MISLEHVENEMQQRVLTRLRKDFQVGSEDWNDVAFTGTKNSLDKKIPITGRTLKSTITRPLRSWMKSLWNENTMEDVHCTPSTHTRYRSLSGTDKLATELGHSSNAVTNSPDVLRWQPLHQLAMLSASTNWRDHIKSQPVKLQYWPLIGPLRVLGFS